MIIDASDMVLGRLCSFVAKKALLGEKIEILNCENVVIIGNGPDILEGYEAKRSRGHPYKGPFFPTLPNLIIRRTVRGMLPYRQYRGRVAFKNVRCYNDTPNEFKGKNIDKIEDFKLSSKHMKFMTMKELCMHLRGYK